MTVDSFKEKVASIVASDKGCGFNMYACLKKEGILSCSVFNLEDNGEYSFKDSLKEKIRSCVIERFLGEETELKPSCDLSDNTNCFYEIVQNSDYMPFNFINENANRNFVDKDKQFIYGFVFVFNLGNREIYAYQHVYPITLPKRKGGVFMYSKGDIYKEFTRELLKVDYRVDAIIVDNSIITDRIKLLQDKFGFVEFIRSSSRRTIQLINDMGIIDNMDRLVNFEGKEKLTNAKKLMKISNSQVLKMDKQIFLDRLQTLPRYKGKLHIENNKINLKTNKDVIELLKILNDDYLISELTKSNYESSTKKLDLA